MKLKSLAAMLALVVVGPAMAAQCTETFSLGTLGPPSLASLSNDFGSVQHFNDCYNFSLNNAADAFGFTLTLDGSYMRDIDITSLSLIGNGVSLLDLTPDSFSFSNLLSGSYQLLVAGDVTGKNGGLFGGGSVGYIGLFSTIPSAIAAPVPEPETYAMLAMGLATVGWVASRRKKS